MKIKWDEKYEVGNVEIDSEHKVFVRIIQKINAASEAGADRKFIGRLLLELSKYAEFHFVSEENIMIAACYPYMIHHKKEHEALLAQLRNFVFLFENNMLDMKEMIAFLIEWFVTHTIKKDRQLAAYLLEETDDSFIYERF